ncbi:MAG: hypothetical protein IK130_11565 [Oscillospiraceae bacterium]|nr:hypothetical protein [Oscillospiraceae bacterium]
MKTELIKQGTNLEPVSRVDYTMGLLVRAAEQGLIPDAKLLEIRRDLQNCAVETAQMYNRGRSGCVTNNRLAAIYRSILHQIDAVLLILQGDDAATEALAQRSVRELQSLGQQRVMALFEQAKTDFRKAYDLMQPFMTDFFRQLLEKFSLFCTKYDAQFNADAQIIERVYPLIGERQIRGNGVIGAAEYFGALRMEAEFLHLFPEETVRGIMKRHAGRYLMTPQSIPDSVADLVFRQYIAAELAGDDGSTLQVTADAAERLNAEFSGRSAADIRVAAELSLLRYSDHPELIAYLKQAVPPVTASMQSAFDTGRLSRWLIVTE